MKVEGIPPEIACPTPASVPHGATVYVGQVEIRNYKTVDEKIITYPLPSVRLVNGVASYLHRDALSSVRAVTGPDGALDETAVYRPFGEQQEWVQDATATGEDKGFIGERYDADAGLQYLNARYYDPKLALFIQPDWFEVTEPGVGTNRYSYSFNDPVNLMDPGGNQVLPTDTGAYVRSIVGMELANPGSGRRQLATDLRTVGGLFLPDFEELTNGRLTVWDAVEVAGIVPVGKVAGKGLRVLAGSNRRVEFSASVRREILEKYSNGNPNAVLHHIGETGSSTRGAKQVQGILKEFHIDEGSVENGVGLVFHGAGRHKNRYSEIVAERLSGLSEPEDVVDELRRIGDELLRIDRELMDGSRVPRGNGKPNTVREFVLDHDEDLND